MKDATPGFSRLVYSPGGLAPTLGLINVIGAATIRVEVLDGAGRTIYEGNATTTGTALSLGALIVAGGCDATLFQNQAVGLFLTVTATVHFNTSGSSDDGVTVTAPLPTASSPRVWVSGQTYGIGWVNL